MKSSSERHPLVLKQSKVGVAWLLKALIQVRGVLWDENDTGYPVHCWRLETIKSYVVTKNDYKKKTASSYRVTNCHTHRTSTREKEWHNEFILNGKSLGLIDEIISFFEARVVRKYMRFTSVQKSVIFFFVSLARPVVWLLFNGLLALWIPLFQLIRFFKLFSKCASIHFTQWLYTCVLGSLVHCADQICSQRRCPF